MSNNISDREEYSDFEYAKLRIAQIEAILENEQLGPGEIEEYKSELASLKPFLAEAAKDTAKFRLVPEDQFEAQLQAESMLRPNQPVYGLVCNHICAITTDYATVNYLTGCGYDLIRKTECHPRRKLIICDVPTTDTLITAAKSLLKSFIDNYTTDGLNRGMNMDTIRTEIAQSLSSIFEPGNLRYLGFEQYEQDASTSENNTVRKLVIFNDIDGVIDMVLDVKNWDNKFNDAVNAGAHAWRDSTNEYSIVITEHLTAAGYRFDALDPNNYDILTDYS